jgi:hypothetical protein
MNRPNSRRAAWLTLLAALALGACNAIGGGGGDSESRSMNDVFNDMEAVADDAGAALPNDGDTELDDLDDDVLETLSGYTDVASLSA